MPRKAIRLIAKERMQCDGLPQREAVVRSGNVVRRRKID